MNTKVLLRMIKSGVVTDSATLSVSAINRNTGLVTLSADLASLFEARYTTVFTDVNGIDGTGAITALASPVSGQPNSFVITAANAGSWGKDIVVNVFHESAGKAVVDAFVSGAIGDNQIKLKSAANFYPNAWVEIDQGKSKHYRKVLAVTGLVITLDGPAMAAGNVTPELVAPDDITYISTTEFRLVASYAGQTEQYSGLTIGLPPGPVLRGSDQHSLFANSDNRDRRAAPRGNRFSSLLASMVWSFH